MPASYPSGILVAVEGIDGAGKTTQVEILRAALEGVGQSPITSKEPTNGRWGTLIKDSAANGRMSLEAELNAFMNDRAEHIQNLVGPALERGEIVILDRYFYSTLAYQGARGANVETLRTLMESRFPVPDVVFVLDIDPSLSMYRIAVSRGEKPNHFEEQEALEKARHIFSSISGPLITHIDGSMSRGAVHDRMLDVFVNGPLKDKRCAKQYGCDDPYHCGPRITNTCPWFRMTKLLRVSATA